MLTKTCYIVARESILKKMYRRSAADFERASCRRSIKTPLSRHAEPGQALIPRYRILVQQPVKLFEGNS